MKTRYTVTVVPNRLRGYDARIYVTFARYDCEGYSHVINAPSEAKARELADAWIVTDKAEQAAFRAQGRAEKKRILSEGECETLEAGRNERDYQ